jgi:hypothetical protein
MTWPPQPSPGSSRLQAVQYEHRRTTRLLISTVSWRADETCAARRSSKHGPLSRPRFQRAKALGVVPLGEHTAYSVTSVPRGRASGKVCGFPPFRRSNRVLSWSLSPPPLPQ